MVPNLLPISVEKIWISLRQACQTQITVRAAHWIVKLEKLTAGRSLELHDTLCQF